MTTPLQRLLETPGAWCFRIADRLWKSDRPGAALVLLRLAAELGSAEAQYTLARRAYSAGTAPDNAEAARWLRRASDQGHPMASGMLATMLSFADGTAANTMLVSRLIRLAPPSDVIRAIHMREKAELASGRPPMWLAPAASPPLPRRAPRAAPADEPPLDLPVCFFAFHLFPKWYFANRDKAGKLTDLALHEHVRQLWRESDRLAVGGGAKIDNDARLPRVQVVQGKMGARWMIQFPGARRMAEPVLMLVDPNAELIRLVEVLAGPELRFGWCSIVDAGKHSFDGVIEARALSSITAECLERGNPRLTEDHPVNAVLLHLLSYAKVNHLFGEAQNADADAPRR